MMKIVKKAAIFLLVVFVCMQFYRPDKNVADADYVQAFEAETSPNSEIKTMLKAACYDCHSAHTEYPWYNNIAPISYWIDGHIEEGKEHIDFSEWPNYSAKKKDHKLEEVIEYIENGKMPLKEYTWTHEDARLTADQRKTLMEWAEDVRGQYQAAVLQE